MSFQEILTLASPLIVKKNTQLRCALKPIERLDEISGKKHAHWHRLLSCQLSARAHCEECSLVHEIIQHVECPMPMASPAKIAEYDTAHLRKQLAPTVTTDA